MVTENTGRACIVTMVESTNIADATSDFVAEIGKWLRQPINRIIHFLMLRIVRQATPGELCLFPPTKRSCPEGRHGRHGTRGFERRQSELQGVKHRCPPAQGWSHRKVRPTPATFFDAYLFLPAAEQAFGMAAETPTQTLYKWTNPAFDRTITKASHWWCRA